MGVIDLNARLTALEKKVDDGGGEVIDQIEAAVTSLESDVSDLQDAVTPVRTTVTELANGTLDTTNGGVYYEKIGYTVHMHVAVTGLTRQSVTELFTLPETLKPECPIRAIGSAAAELDGNYAFIAISASNGKAYAFTNDTACIGEVWYTLPVPSEETTPAEE